MQCHQGYMAPLKKITVTTRVPLEVRALLSRSLDVVTFTHVDPTEALVRMLVTGPLADDPANLAFFPRNSATYDDFCDGERLARIQAAIPSGTAALTSVLFFDEINRDAKGFVTGDGAIIVGGFFTRNARESSYAKVSLGTFPQLPVAAVNRKRKAIKDFRTVLRAKHHRSILNCYHAFNRKGGQLVPLQTGEVLYFIRAAVLAIYADQPAAVKCSLTGSACPVCYTRLQNMNLPLHPATLKRTDENMRRRRRNLHLYAERRDAGSKARAQMRAKRVGIPWGALSPWQNDTSGPGDWVFGPDRTRDNVYQCLPQVTLHGMDEGLISKLNFGALNTYLDHRMETQGVTAAQVCKTCDINVS